MQFSIRRLRWVLLAGALLLVAVLIVFIGYGRYRALDIYNKLIKHSGATISHDTSGYTYSQTEGGKTIFTLHAAKATQLGDGKWGLHDVSVTLYGRSQERTDHITGSEFTYDEKEGIVRAIGEVHMDLQAPQSLTSAGRAAPQGDNLATLQTAKPNAVTPSAESANVIHIRTSGLVYLRKLGVAATDQPVEFHYAGIQCTAVGAEFNSSQSTVRLLSNVVANGIMHGRPVNIHSTTADIDRTANIATLVHTIAVSNGRTASADQTLLNLRKDGSIQSAKATGHVLLAGKTQQVTASQLDATLTPQTVLQTARLSGGVTLADTNSLRPIHGTASVTDILFDEHGSPSRVTANGAAHTPARLSVNDKHENQRGLQRELQGDRIIALFVPATKHGSAHTSSQLTQVHAIGSARVHSESVAKPLHPSPLQTQEPQLKTTTVVADDLQLDLVPDAQGKSQPQKLFADGHTLLQQDAPLGEQETSSGDKLNAVFSPADNKGKQELTLASALQTGHIIVHSTPPLKPSSKPTPSGFTKQETTSATADRASYDGTTDKLTLSGNTHLTQDNTSLTATSVVLDQRTQDADASGNIQATLQNTQSPADIAAAKNPQFTHVLAASAHFTHDTRQAEFHGTDAQPAKMWQAASQVQAATLLLDDVRKTFSARASAPGALVHAVFAGSTSTQHPQESKQKLSTRSNIVRVSSAKLDYSDLQREAVFTTAPGSKDVLIEGDSGTIHAQRASVFLAPATPSGTSKSAVTNATPTPFNGSLDRVIITGDVQLDQTGRHGTGDRLVYTAATGNSVLTGSPGHLPHIQDAQQGSITGASLLFGDAGSTIVVSGESDSASPSRVHTETHLQNGKEERQ